MRVVIGPVSAHSARAWLGYADRTLDEIGALAPGESFTTADTVEFLRGFVRTWQLLSFDDVFLWEDDVPTEQAEYAMHALYRVVEVLARRAEVHGRAAPPEGDPFYLAVVQGMLGALEAESASSAAFARELAEFWPGWAEIG